MSVRFCCIELLYKNSSTVYFLLFVLFVGFSDLGAFSARFGGTEPTEGLRWEFLDFSLFSGRKKFDKRSSEAENDRLLLPESKNTTDQRAVECSREGPQQRAPGPRADPGSPSFRKELVHHSHGL